MNFKKVVSINAVLFIAAGVFILLAGWRLMYWHGISIRHGWPTEAIANALRLRPLLSLAGCLLLGCGWLAWLSREQTEIKRQSHIAMALLITSVYASYLVFATGVSDMHNIKLYRRDWLSAALFLIPAALWLYWLSLGKETISPTTTLPLEIATLKEQWSQQISAAAAQEERNRLARELHDSIKQQLFSIHVSAATVQTRWESDATGAQAALADVRDRVREALAEMEAMLHNLRATPLANFGFTEALRREAEALHYRIGIPVTTEFGELPAEQDFPPGAQEALFRIAQEALSNVARHARAQNVQIRLHHQVGGNHNAVWLRISDDGIGFSAANSEGMGLANMRARVRQHGGALQLESTPGGGTHLVAQVPLPTATPLAGTHPVMLAVFLTLVGFLGFGLGTIITAQWMLILFGCVTFGLSAWSYQRAYRQIKRLCADKTLSWQKTFALQLDWHYGFALFWGLMLWSAMRWLVLVEGTSKSKIILWVVWNLNMRSVWETPRPLLTLLWFLPLLLIAYSIHRLVKAEATFHSTNDFRRALAPLGKRYSSYFVITAFALLLLYWTFAQLTFFLFFALVILMYWLQLSWQRFTYRQRTFRDEKQS